MREFHSDLQRDGFLGTLYQPGRNRFPGKAVIVAGGGDGMFSFTDSVAERLAQEGMWESARSCREIVKRLKDKNYPHPVEYYHYPYGSHMLFPDCNPLKGMFRMEREHPREYHESCRDSLQKTLEFFRKW